MLTDWSGEFETWLNRLDERATRGDATAITRLQLVTAQLDYLEDLQEAPQEDTFTLKRVRQSRNNTVWRVSHPYVPGIAVRLIVWFPPDRPDEVVVGLFAGDKANMGDVFYGSVGPRADAAISTYRMTREGGQG